MKINRVLENNRELQNKQREGIRYFLNVTLLIHVYFPIMLGASIYTFFRTDTLLVFKGYEILGLMNYIDEVRNFTLYWEIAPFIKYSLPDGLWVYAFTYFMARIWKGQKWSVEKVIFLYAPFIFGVGGEFLQLFWKAIGTFDSADLLLSFVAFVLAYVGAKPMQEHKKLKLTC